MENNRKIPTFAEAMRVWARIGILSFGGPAAQIALMHREIVEQRGWLSEKRFLDALGFCMLLPGPEAMQLATFAGWRLHGVIGGLAAGLLFVLPGAVMMLALAALYAAFGDVPLADALFLGVKAAVVVIVVEALLRVAKKALGSAAHWVIAALAFIAIFVFAIPFPMVVAAAALWGFVFEPRGGEDYVAAPGPGLGRTFATIVIWLFFWWAPLLMLFLAPASSLLADLGLFFSKLAVVTFGGAYAVLAYMAQEVVELRGWLTAGEMLDGLGLAETTMGPLILVTEFVGFVAGAKQGGFLLGLGAAAVTLWATFVPCFLWIFTGAPYVDWIGSQPRLRGALAAITAAVVGVIANLALWFAIHVFFTRVTDVENAFMRFPLPELTSLDWRVASIFVFTAILLLRLHWGVAKVLAMAAALGALTMLF